jgi:hypothetical protein
MPNSPAPTGILINYHSSFGFHKQYLKALEWHASVGSVAGVVDTWDSGSIDLDDMVNALIDLFVPFYPATVAWDNYVVYVYDLVTAPPVPLASGSLTQVGTAVSPGWSKAVQDTLTWRTNLFGLVRIVMLDCASAGDFDKHTDIPTGSPIEALNAEFTADSNGWSGQDNGQPATYLGSTRTLNEKLRRSYRMT